MAQRGTKETDNCVSRAVKSGEDNHETVSLRDLLQQIITDGKFTKMVFLNSSSSGTLTVSTCNAAFTAGTLFSHRRLVAAPRLEKARRVERLLATYLAHSLKRVWHLLRASWAACS